MALKMRVLRSDMQYACRLAAHPLLSTTNAVAYTRAQALFYSCILFGQCTASARLYSLICSSNAALHKANPLLPLSALIKAGPASLIATKPEYCTSRRPDTSVLPMLQ